MPALWLAALAAFLQARWVGHHNSERGAHRSVCLQQPGTGARLGGTLSQTQCSSSYLARRQTTGRERRGAAPLPTRRAAGANGVSLILVASMAKRLTPCFSRQQPANAFRRPYFNRSASSTSTTGTSLAPTSRMASRMVLAVAIHWI